MQHLYPVAEGCPKHACILLIWLHAELGAGSFCPDVTGLFRPMPSRAGSLADSVGRIVKEPESWAVQTLLDAAATHFVSTFPEFARNPCIFALTGLGPWVQAGMHEHCRRNAGGWSWVPCPEMGS